MKTKFLILLILLFVNGVSAIAANAVTHKDFNSDTTINQTQDCIPRKDDPSCSS